MKTQTFLTLIALFIAGMTMTVTPANAQDCGPCKRGEARLHTRFIDDRFSRLVSESE